MKKNYQQIREGLNTLVDVVTELNNRPIPQPQILDRELSGNKINGGIITNFSSVGIKDEAKNPVLTVHDNGITVNKAQINEIVVPLSVNGALTVAGEITATKLHVNELSADVRNERTSSLEFKAENNSLNGKGLIWTGSNYTKQFVYKENPNKFWSSEDIDLNRDHIYRIDNLPVVTLTSLGPSIIHSSLKKLGTVQDLKTEGNVNFDNFLFWDSETERLGIGTEQPNGMLSLKSIDHEFVIDPTIDKKWRIGTWTTGALELITDDTVRIEVNANGNIALKNKVTIDGKLGIGVKNFTEDVDITTAGPVRFQNKKFQIGNNIPQHGNYLLGDIIWNENPQPTGYIGWVCVRTGTPGEWKPFGLIQS